MARTGHLKRPDCSIYFEIAGSGPPLVFAHGLGGNHMSWWQQVAHFAKSHTCVVFAHRGFTPSSAVPGETAPDAYADDLAALINELDLGEVTLVAQSMGGWTCLEYALREPGRVRALVMACTSGAIDCARLENFSSTFSNWLAYSEKAFADLQARDISVASGERMEHEQPALARLYRQITELTPADFRTAVRARLRQLRTQSPALLKRLQTPALFITGEEDCVFPPAAGAPLAALAPKGKAVCVPRAGHSVYFERASEFNPIVDEFLTTL
ncbi:MAG: alpha/beta fold hydrolase [Burkholderiales bacterium]